MNRLPPVRAGCGEKTSGSRRKRYSRTDGNPHSDTPSFPRRRESTSNTPSFPRRRESTIPAHAGIHRPVTPMPEKNTPLFPYRRKSAFRYSVIPAHAGIHRPVTSMPEKNTPSFPHRRKSAFKYSVIPAKAGIVDRAEKSLIESGVDRLWPGIVRFKT